MEADGLTSLPVFISSVDAHTVVRPDELTAGLADSEHADGPQQLQCLDRAAFNLLLMLRTLGGRKVQRLILICFRMARLLYRHGNPVKKGCPG